MKKTKVTIGITAYNEEKNIQSLLRSISEQKQEIFRIEKIIIVLDGCTDSTRQKIDEMKMKEIEIISHKKRGGKTSRLQEIFSHVTSEILILFDADVTLANPYTCAHLVKTLMKQRRPGMVSGRPIARYLSTFMEKAVQVSLVPYQEFAEKVSNGRTIYSVKGAVLALARPFVETIHMPKNIFANDTYLYFSCIQQKFNYDYAKQAVVWYELPKTIRDHIKQNTRFIAAEDTMKQLFGEAVSQEFNKSKVLLYKLLFFQILSYPRESFFLAAVNFYCRLRAKNIGNKISPTWSTAESTKRGEQV